MKTRESEARVKGVGFDVGLQPGLRPQALVSPFENGDGGEICYFQGYSVTDHRGSLTGRSRLGSRESNFNWWDLGAGQY
jgi:hypothetical protein